MKKFKYSRKIITILIIIVAVILSIELSSLLKRDYLESLYYSAQIVSSLFVISGVVIGVWQYYLSQRSAKKNLEIIQVQRAIDMSEYYKNNILKYYPAIRYVFERSGIVDILGVLNRNSLNDFDKHELQNLISETNLNKLKEIEDSDEFCIALMEANDIYSLGFNIKSLTVIDDKITCSTIKEIIDKAHIYVAFMSNLINEVLNNMEFFALHFKHNTADESSVYQSLHQSYLEIVVYLYFYIANSNTDSSNKLYTNVVWLFEKWRSKKVIQDADRSQKSKSIPSHGTIIENDY